MDEVCRFRFREDWIEDHRNPVLKITEMSTHLSDEGEAIANMVIE